MFHAYRVVNAVVVHPVCGLPVACEFSYMDGAEHVATELYVDYAVCEKHLTHAVNNVASR